MPSVQKKASAKKTALTSKSVPAEEFITLANETESESEISSDEENGEDEDTNGKQLTAIGDHVGNAQTEQIQVKIAEKLGAITVDAEVTAGGKRKKVKKVVGENLSGKRGVLYLGNIPFGFFEDEMKTFFGQFGTITKLKLSRSKKTGNSKGYGFIEFEHEEVAEIVATAMDNYLLFERLMKCKRVPANKVHPDTFKNSDRKFKKIDWTDVARVESHKPKTSAQIKINTSRLLAKERKHRAKLAAAGVDYDYPGYAHAAAQPATMISDEPEDTSAHSAVSTPTSKSHNKTSEKKAATPTLTTKGTPKQNKVPSKTKAQTRSAASPKATPVVTASVDTNAPTPTSTKKSKNTKSLASKTSELTPKSSASTKKTSAKTGVSSTPSKAEAAVATPRTATRASARKSSRISSSVNADAPPSTPTTSSKRKLAPVSATKSASKKKKNA
eukprot:CFRG1090T1